MMKRVWYSVKSLFTDGFVKTLHVKSKEKAIEYLDRYNNMGYKNLYESNGDKAKVNILNFFLLEKDEELYIEIEDSKKTYRFFAK